MAENNYDNWGMTEGESLADYVSRLTSQREGGVLGRGMFTGQHDIGSKPTVEQAAQSPLTAGVLGMLKSNEGDGSQTQGKGSSRAQNNNFGYINPDIPSVVSTLFGLPQPISMALDLGTALNNMEAIGVAQDLAGIERSAWYDRLGKTPTDNIGNVDIGDRNYGVSIGGVDIQNAGLFDSIMGRAPTISTTLTPREANMRATMARQQAIAQAEAQARAYSDALSGMDTSFGYAGGYADYSPSSMGIDNSGSGGGLGGGGYGGGTGSMGSMGGSNPGGSADPGSVGGDHY